MCAVNQNWTEDEFNTILLNPNSTNDELSKLLNGRSVESIAGIRAFIHNFHVRGNISGLNKQMINRLQQGYWICPLCHARVQKYGYPAYKGWVP